MMFLGSLVTKWSRNSHIIQRISHSATYLYRRSLSHYREYYPDIAWKVRNELDVVEFPPDRRKLHPVLKQPPPPASGKIPKHPKRKIDYRGPEELHNRLNYRQYGIQALEGGELLFGHFEMIRSTVNKKIVEKRMFAVWGVEAPWKSKSKRPAGSRMGGGKADIHHYVTPIKAGRIVIELGGYLDWREAYNILSRVADKLPFRARFISQELLDTEANIEAFIAAKNVNPFAGASNALAHNYGGCWDYISPYYLQWGTIDYH